MRVSATLASVLVVAAACKRHGGDHGQPPPPPAARDAPAAAPADAASPGQAAPTLAELTALFGDDAKATATLQADPATFAWLLFAYLDWPATPGERGAPNPAGHLGADAPVVWQTWKEVHETYLAGGAKPPPWKDGGPKGPPTLSTSEIDGKTLTDVAGNPVTYTVLLNQGTFDYLLGRDLYAMAGQVALRKAGVAPVAFPPSAMEIKASWRILDPVKDKDRMGHYLVAKALLPQQGGAPPFTVTVGLTGLHITSKLVPQWAWITFEQVDNAETTGVTAKLPIDPAAQAANEKFQQALAGTPLASYRLMGVQTAFTDAGKPTLLANTQIETYFQTSSSCITCHALASIGPSSKPRFELFHLVAGNLEGYTGDPPAAPFGPGPEQYVKLDFVWSMREAK